MNSKLITGVLFALFATSHCIAQHIEITGKVVYAGKDSLLPLQKASIVLLKKDSSFVSAVISSENGIFTVKNIAKDDYLLNFSAISYSDYYIILNNLKQSIDLGEIMMSHKTETLQEVVIEGSRVVQKIDRSVYYPLPSQVKKSTDAIDLLFNLMIPRLNVNILTRQLDASGGLAVETRINNMPATASDVSSIMAKDILRIEYLENPGNRYGVGLGAVINIVTKKREDGGQVALRASDCPYVFWGENFISGKYNYKKSQWTLAYTNINRGFNKSKIDMHEVYTTADKTIERYQKGIYDKRLSHDHYINLVYNISDPDKYVFNAAFRNNISITPYNYKTAKMFSLGSTDTLLSKVFTKNTSYSPVLDLYYQKSLSGKRSIELNVVGTKINSDYNRQYTETALSGNTITDILRNVSGEKYSLIADANFDKEFKAIKLTAGIKHAFGKTNNIYAGNTAYSTSMRQAETRGYMEFQGKIGNVGYVAGTGLTRSFFRENAYQSEYYSFTPLFRLNYNPSKYSNLRYYFDVTPKIPSLSSLTNVDLMIDTIQIYRGNPTLKIYNTYTNSLTYTHTYKKIQSSLLVKYLYASHPVMEDYFTEGNKIINTENNQKSFGNFNTELNLRLRDVKLFNIPDFLSFNTSLGYNHFNSRGNSYIHRYGDFYYTFLGIISWHSIMFGTEYRKFRNDLFGETIRTGLSSLTFLAQYKKKNLELGAFIIQPFQRTLYERSARLNAIAKLNAENYVKDMARMLVVRFAYNFEFGKAYKTKNKNKNNEDKDAGIVR